MQHRYAPSLHPWHAPPLMMGTKLWLQVAFSCSERGAQQSSPGLVQYMLLHMKGSEGG